jgi:uncharacterized protein YfaA (DUF2138 family)
VPRVDLAAQRLDLHIRHPQLADQRRQPRSRRSRHPVAIRRQGLDKLLHPATALPGDDPELRQVRARSAFTSIVR